MHYFLDFLWISKWKLIKTSTSQFDFTVTIFLTWKRFDIESWFCKPCMTPLQATLGVRQVNVSIWLAFGFRFHWYMRENAKLNSKKETISMHMRMYMNTHDLRPNVPTNTHPQLKEFMYRCWDFDSGNYLSFSQIWLLLEGLLLEILVNLLTTFQNFPWWILVRKWSTLPKWHSYYNTISLWLSCVC